MQIVLYGTIWLTANTCSPTNIKDFDEPQASRHAARLYLQAELQEPGRQLVPC